MFSTIINSGSTCSCALIKDGKIITANIGDSRSIIGTSRGEKIRVRALTRDHKPSDKSEAERIISKGGVIAKGNGAGPYRIWRRKDKIPGLAVSRSLGDTVAAQLGVSSEPGKDKD